MTANSWAFWLVVSILLAICVGIIIWFAIDEARRNKTTPTPIK